MFTGTIAVVKKFKNDKNAARLTKEFENLQAVVSLAKEQLCTKCEYVSDDKTALILTPVGIPFASRPFDEVNLMKKHVAASAADFAKLLDILKRVRNNTW